MKHEIRKEALCRREGGHDPTGKSSEIAERLFEQPEYKQAKKILLYFSIGSEVDTCRILKDALETKEVYLPYVDGDRMGFSRVKSLRDLEPGEYGIPEPVNKEENNPEIIDLVIVPGIAFDETGHRVGYGGGYYDRFLPMAKANTIALAYDVQVIKDIPAEHHDQPVKKIVTEKRVITC
ncbi:5-formyltetrahydrofolate cyclo-ligase [archaeon]